MSSNQAVAGSPSDADVPFPSRREAIPTKATWRPRFLTWFIVVVAVGGLLAGLYPTAAGWFSSYNQAQVVDGYPTQIENVHPDAATQLRLAKEYNDALTYGVLVAADDNIPQGEEGDGNEKLDYWSILKANDEGLMSRVRIPKIDVDLPIYHGTSDEVLDEGAGHLQGSHLPVGGNSTRTVITAHRGLPDADMFDDLGKLDVGDRFVLETFGKVLTYEVIETKVIEPHETDEVRLIEDKDLATLITCTPLGLNTHRFLVTGERVHPTPQSDIDAAGAKSDLPRFPWWILILIGGLAAAGTYLWRQGLKDGMIRAALERAEKAQDGVESNLMSRKS